MSQLTYDQLTAEMDNIRKSWGWFLVLGIALAGVGISCTVFAATATLATTLVFGWLLLIGAVFQTIHAVRTGTWSGSTLYLITALFRGFTGFLLIQHPLIGSEALTVVLASFFTVAGQFRAIVSAILKLPRWRWVVLSGVITAVLGFILLAQMPVSGLRFIGFALGVDFTFDGVATIWFAAAVHRVSHRAVFSVA
jgi:uncharacterized membrane protein HdeD (DUF308 family)